MKTGFWRAAIFRLIAVALAVGTVSDGRTSRIAYAQGAVDPVVVKARAAVNRGQYAEAEALLKPLTARTPDGEAALELGLFYEMMGRRDESLALLGRIADIQAGPRTSPVEYARLGRAARALGEFQLANDAYRIATEKAPNDPSLHTGWGELFLQVHNNAEAAKSFQDALSADDKWIPALVGMAHALLDVNPPAAEKAVEQALALDPDVVDAHLLKARLELDKSDREAAKASIAKAKGVNPSSLDALALSGAVAYIEDRHADLQKEAGAALAINPRFSGAYRVPAELAAGNYRFEEAVALSRKALEIDPNDVRTLSALGVQLLRTGDEAEARQVLEKSFAIDKFDQTTFNLLTMLDSLDKFDTTTAGDVVFKSHPSETPVMREYVAPLAQRALAIFSEKYQFTPKGPILIEMFPKHDDFAVRTIGLPGFIGALGACFGKVVTLDSPRARPPGTFSWTATLWHEMAHVISLQMSNNRVPRWISEGISQFEERRARPEWGRETEIPFAQALEAGKLLKIRDINEGFSDPQMISLVYHQSSLVIEHLVAAYGEPALWRLLRAYGEGLETDAAFKAAFNATIDEIQVSFDARLNRDYAALRAALKTPEIPEGATADQLKALATDNPGSFAVHMRLAQALNEAGDVAGALEALERAGRLVPAANGQANPNAIIAQLALKQGDTTRAIRALEAVVKVESADVEAARRLASLVAPLGDAARTAEVYAIVAELDPFDGQAQAVVGRRALAQRDAPRALRALRAALAAGPADKATAHADLAEAHLLAGQLGDARRETLAALEIAPSFERAQDLLLEIIDAQPASN